MNSIPDLTTERLRLTVPDRASARAVLDYFERNRSHLEAWSPPAPDDFYTLDFWIRRAAIARDELAAGRSLRLLVRPRHEPARVIGTCNYTEVIRGGFQACLLGYGLDQHQVGKGLMEEALRRSLDFVFTEFGLHRVMANYMPINQRSGALLRRLGFVVEGYARDYLFINGAWRDHILTALNNPSPRPPRRP